MAQCCHDFPQHGTIFSTHPFGPVDERDPNQQPFEKNNTAFPQRRAANCRRRPGHFTLNPTLEPRRHKDTKERKKVRPQLSAKPTFSAERVGWLSFEKTPLRTTIHESFRSLRKFLSSQSIHSIFLIRVHLCPSVVTLPWLRRQPRWAFVSSWFLQFLLARFKARAATSRLDSGGVPGARSGSPKTRRIEMIRRDYILRMIEEFIRALARIRGLTRSKQFGAAADLLDQEFKRLVGDGADAVSRLSETELLARLMEGEPQAVRDKCLILTRLLREAGELHSAQHRVPESHACFLKALNLLLDVLLRHEAFEVPEFVPKVEELTLLLTDAALPRATQAALMQLYESIGEFAKAEDKLFSLIESEPGERALTEWGAAFYERLLRHSDAALQFGNLPRPEVEAGLAELRARVPQ
jgi:hypothetical protein